MNKFIEKDQLVQRVLWSLIIVLGALIIFFSYRRSDKRTQITSAYITEITMEYKGGMNVRYQFTVNNTVYSNVDAISTIGFASKSSFLHRYFPVIYEPENPKNCNLMLAQLDFEEHDIPYPDSLRWIQERFYPHLKIK
ncbi:hypothetical protein [Solitalea canadensis]|uniref:Uncharacterized protein n=1 Tax=Solitalea canadensis (strain ATCC 29591 / DSM 3403 / JCM 21819 / LMG 8368 / NBRC 15130 / NCIMB 12057 / USAM 9D) TaxID=929556 RepID=H8KQJ4_SOLCM|nr:hypothetical protein [Solitalea canadensis]AFD06732.1 hypothetical protein Solca_1666 [Solitalea canadensis DSM 3403]